MSPDGPKIRAEVREWREKGLSARAIAELYGLTEWVVDKWVRGIPMVAQRPLRVAYHPQNRCWHIYMYECRKSGLADKDPETGIDWWPLEWMRWGTEEAAQAYLEKHGEFAA